MRGIGQPSNCEGVDLDRTEESEAQGGPRSRPRSCNLHPTLPTHPPTHIQTAIKSTSVRACVAPPTPPIWMVKKKGLPGTDVRPGA